MFYNLTQIIFRYLMKVANDVRNGGPKEEPSEIVQYYFRPAKSTTCLIDQAYDTNHQYVLDTFEHASKRATLAAYDKLQGLKQKGLSNEQAWNETAVELCKVIFI